VLEKKKNVTEDPQKPMMTNCILVSIQKLPSSITAAMMMKVPTKLPALLQVNISMSKLKKIPRIFQKQPDY
jgi:hypothetical protein